MGDAPVTPLAQVDAKAFTLADRWILGRLDVAIAECDAGLGPPRPPTGRWPETERQVGMRLDAYAESARRFVWNELADWYVEAVKARLAQPGADREVARAVLVHMFDQGLRLLHPIMPFVTESLWQRLPGATPGRFLATARWPQTARARGGDGADFEVVREAIDAIRRLRSEYGVTPGQTIRAFVAKGNGAAALQENAALLHRLARAEVHVGAAPAGAAAHAVLPSGLELALPLEGMVDLAKECARLRGELDGLSKQLTALRGRLANEKFTAKAPADVVEAERVKEREWSARADQLSAKVAELCG